MHKTLREYVREVNKMLNEADTIVAAGVIVVKFIDEEYKVLVLKKYDGTWDLTKGKIDNGETSFEAAIRETEEESGINDLSFKWGTESIRYGKGELFLAMTNSQPYIPVNPASQKKEHTELKFVSFDKALEIIDSKLKPGIKWAMSKILN